MQKYQRPARYFAAANGIGGFSSLFSSIFSPFELKRIYIIKGGPGSGKSTFLKQCAYACTHRGILTEQILCSSDPDSLDGLILPEEKIALLDGTAPHAAEPLFPGAAETVLNFFEYFDCAALTEKKEELFALTEEKKRMYQSAYRLLHTLGPLQSELDCRILDFFDEEKAKSAAIRTLRRISPKSTKSGTLYLSACSTKGAVTVPSGAAALLRIEPLCGAEFLLMELFRQILKNNGFSCLRVASTPDTEKTNALLFENGEIQIGAKEKGVLHMNTARFLKSHVSPAVLRRTTQSLRGIYDSILQEALSCLAKAGKAHEKIETVYHPYIDFDALGEFTTRFIRENLLPQCNGKHLQ